MGGKLNAAIAGLVIASGCAVDSDVDTADHKSCKVTEVPDWYREGCKALDAEKSLEDAFAIIDQEKRQMITALGGTREGMNEPNEAEGRFLMPIELVGGSASLLHIETEPFAIACVTSHEKDDYGAILGRDYQVSREAMKKARKIIAPGIEDYDHKFSEAREIRSTSDGVVVCVRSEMNQRVDSVTEREEFCNERLAKLILEACADGQCR